MSENVAQIYTAIRVRLSPAQIAVLAPGIELITRSYQDSQRVGTSRLSYPFRLFPPPRGFDRGDFNQLFMDNFLDLGEDLSTKAKTRTSVQMDTFQLRASVFAIRAYIDFARLLRRQNRLRIMGKVVALEGKARMPLTTNHCSAKGEVATCHLFTRTSYEKSESSVDDIALGRNSTRN